MRTDVILICVASVSILIVGLFPPALFLLLLGVLFFAVARKLGPPRSPFALAVTSAQLAWAVWFVPALFRHWVTGDRLLAAAIVLGAIVWFYAAPTLASAIVVASIHGYWCFEYLVDLRRFISGLGMAEIAETRLFLANAALCALIVATTILFIRSDAIAREKARSIVTKARDSLGSPRKQA